MGHSTASGREATGRRLSEAFGISDEEMTRRSQVAIRSLKPSKRAGDIREFTLASAATNRLYYGEIFANTEGGGYTMSLNRSNGNGNVEQIIRYENYDNLTKAKNAIYEATQIPKPRKGRS